MNRRVRSCGWGASRVKIGQNGDRGGAWVTDLSTFGAETRWWRATCVTERRSGARVGAGNHAPRPCCAPPRALSDDGAWGPQGRLGMSTNLPGARVVASTPTPWFVGSVWGCCIGTHDLGACIYRPSKSCRSQTSTQTPTPAAPEHFAPPRNLTAPCPTPSPTHPRSRFAQQARSPSAEHPPVQLWEKGGVCVLPQF